MLRKIRRDVHIPIVAIGWVSRNNAESLFAAGADAVAVASAIFTGDITANVTSLMQCIERDA